MLLANSHKIYPMQHFYIKGAINFIFFLLTSEFLSFGVINDQMVVSRVCTYVVVIQDHKSVYSY